MRPKHLTQEVMKKLNQDYLVEFIKKFFDKYPDMFRREPNTLRDNLLADLGGGRIKLRKYPDVIHAMYENE